MIGNDSFCPKSGAPLSEKQHYDEGGRPRRAVRLEGPSGDVAMDGELTNGAVRSARTALFNHFKRCHQQHDDADDDLYQRASLALCRLKRTATGTQEWDVYVWYVLEKRLRRIGFETEWMHTHATLRCPYCHGRLGYREVADGVVARCGTNCTDDSADRLGEIRRLLADLYATAFPNDEPSEADAFLQF